MGLSLLFCFLVATSTFAGDINYFYDEVGRLTRAVTSTQWTNYQYDEVGNLISTETSQIDDPQQNQVPPALQSITPDTIIKSSAIYVTIAGQHLLTTKAVTSSNPSLSIRTLNVTDTEIRTLMTVSSSVTPGTAIISVSTLYGSATIQVALSQSTLSFSPDMLAMAPGVSSNITATISPSIGKELTVQIKNSNAAVISAPQSVTITLAGTASFGVNALRKGTATVSSDSSITQISVVGDVVPYSRAVSVYLPASNSGNGVFLSQAVSIYLSPPNSGNAVLVSPSVSVAIQPLSSLTLNPVTVIGTGTSQGTVTLSGPAPSGGATITLSSSNTGAATVPASVTVASGASSATFTVNTSQVSSTTAVTITGTYGTGTQSASLTVTPSLISVSLNPTSVKGGGTSQGTVTLSGSAPSGGATVTLTSSNTGVATVPASVTVAAGASSAKFTVTTKRVSSSTSVTITGTYGTGTKNASLTVTK